MPLKRCTKKGKKGWKWGDQGTCYVGKNGKKKAQQQMRAIKANKGEK